MAVLQEYKIGSMAVHRHVRRVQLLGLLPFGIALLLMSIHTGIKHPLLFLVAGACLGLELIFWGVFEIQFKVSARSGMAQRIKTTGRRLFPAFLMVLQKTFFIMTFVMLWEVLKGMSPQITGFTNLCFYGVVALIPLRNLFRELGLNPQARWKILSIAFVQLLSTAFTILLVMGLVTNAMGTGAVTADGNASPLLIIFWVPGALTIFLITLKFVDHAIRIARQKPRSHALDDPGHTGTSVAGK